MSVGINDPMSTFGKFGNVCNQKEPQGDAGTCCAW